MPSLACRNSGCARCVWPLGSPAREPSQLCAVAVGKGLCPLSVPGWTGKTAVSVLRSQPHQQAVGTAASLSAHWTWGRLGILCEVLCRSLSPNTAAKFKSEAINRTVSQERLGKFYTQPLEHRSAESLVAINRMVEEFPLVEFHGP